MKQELIDLVKYRLEKAKDTLSDAGKYVEGGITYTSIVNRIYYSMFYAVSALLIMKGFSSSKHTGIRSLFNKEIINEGLIDKHFGKFYSDMFDNRQEGDYKDFVRFEKEDVEKWLKKAGGFIDEIERLILQILEERESIARAKEQVKNGQTVSFHDFKARHGIK